MTQNRTNFRFKRLYSSPKDKGAGISADQTVVLTTYKSKKDYPDKLGRVSYVDNKSNKRLVFLTNNFALPAPVIAEIY